MPRQNPDLNANLENPHFDANADGGLGTNINDTTASNVEILSDDELRKKRDEAEEDD